MQSRDKPGRRKEGCASRQGPAALTFPVPESRLAALAMAGRFLVSVTRAFLFLRAENYWWRGQNKRTLKVGQFPRNTVTSVAGLSAHDISQPLKNSFIHTGHGDTNSQHCWGFPDKIDE